MNACEIKRGLSHKGPADFSPPRLPAIIADKKQLDFHEFGPRLSAFGGAKFIEFGFDLN
jgi:hypothetical protein